MAQLAEGRQFASALSRWRGIPPLSVPARPGGAGGQMEPPAGNLSLRTRAREGFPWFGRARGNSAEGPAAGRQAGARPAAPAATVRGRAGGRARSATAVRVISRRQGLKLAVRQAGRPSVPGQRVSLEPQGVAVGGVVEEGRGKGDGSSGSSRRNSSGRSRGRSSSKIRSSRRSPSISTGGGSRSRSPSRSSGRISPRSQGRSSIRFAFVFAGGGGAAVVGGVALGGAAVNY